MAKASEEADNGRKSRTIYVTDAEWQQINEDAETEGRKVSRHIVKIVQERRSK